MALLIHAIDTVDVRGRDNVIIESMRIVFQFDANVVSQMNSITRNRLSLLSSRRGWKLNANSARVWLRRWRHDAMWVTRWAIACADEAAPVVRAGVTNLAALAALSPRAGIGPERQAQHGKRKPVALGHPFGCIIEP